jgi:ferric-dicitrate binding protein FerR (iron transport regulator)
MPVLTEGQVVRSREPNLVVENDLAAGAWRFQLVVVDQAGLESAPAELIVRVQRRGPIRPIDPDIVEPRRPIDPRIIRERIRPDSPLGPIRPIRPNR